MNNANWVILLMVVLQGLLGDCRRVLQLDRYAPQSLPVRKAVVPYLTVKNGRVFTPDWGPRPWGWEPDRALPAGGSTGGGC
jgi:hypothetical protein